MVSFPAINPSCGMWFTCKREIKKTTLQPNIRSRVGENPKINHIKQYSHTSTRSHAHAKLPSEGYSFAQQSVGQKWAAIFSPSPITHPCTVPRNKGMSDSHNKVTYHDGKVGAYGSACSLSRFLFHFLVLRFHFNHPVRCGKILHHERGRI